MNNIEKNLPEEYKPLSPWAYWGLTILFSVPVLGFIFLIIFSIKKSNINRRNFARSFWCTYVLILIIFLVMCIAGVISEIDLSQILNSIKL